MGIPHMCRVHTGLKRTWIYRTVLKSPWKINLPWKVLEKHSKALECPWILPFTGWFNTVFGELNHYKIEVPLFGAAYAAPNKGTTILYRFSKTIISLVMDSSQHFRSRILTFELVCFISFQSLKMVEKSFISPWNVLEFYTNLPVWTLM